MRKDILILGAGGFAREVLCTIEDINQNRNEWNIIGFLDDNATKWGAELSDYPIFNPIEFLNKRQSEIYIGNGIGSCFVKYSLAKRFAHSNVKFANLIHPSVIMGRRVNLDGIGITIQAGTILTTDITIKDHVTINIDVTVGHDCFIHPYVTIAPGVHLSGFVSVGYGTDVGTGSAIIQGLNIGNECVIGANASVIRDIPDYSVAVGIPAKVIKTREPKIGCQYEGKSTIE